MSQDGATWDQRVIRVNHVAPPAGHKRWAGYTARMALSEIADKSHSAVFHHTSDGKNCQGRPSIRFRGGNNGFGIIQTSIDERIAMNVVDLISNYALDHEGTLMVNKIKCGIQESEIERYHGVFVCGKRNALNKNQDGSTYINDRSDFNKKMYADIDFRHAELSKMIARGLCYQFHEARVAGLVGMTGHANMGRIDKHGHINLESIQDLIDDITITKSEEKAPAKRCLPRFYVEFNMPFALKGDWAAGSLTNQGYGHIIHCGAYQ